MLSLIEMLSWWWLSKIKYFAGSMVSTVPRLLSDGKRAPGTSENYFRMDPELFNLLLGLVTPYIEKQQTQLRALISVESRLGATLRFLATGHTYSELHYQFRIGNNTLLSHPRGINISWVSFHHFAKFCYFSHILPTWKSFKDNVGPYRLSLLVIAFSYFWGLC